SQQVTNGAAIRFDAAFVETIHTDAVARGQETVDLGAFTGNNLVGFDAIQTGDNGTATAYYVTPEGRFNTGYFLSDAHRLAFATDNDTFSMLISESVAELTPEIMGQLVGSDEYLGLFRRTNHGEDAVDLGRVVIGRSLEGKRVVLGASEGAGVAVSPVKIARLVFTGDGNAPAIMPEGARFAGAIRNGQIPLTELDLAAGEVRRIIGFGGRVIVKCANSTNLDIGLQTATGLSIDLYDVDLNLNLASLDTAERLSLGKDDGTALSYTVGGVGATVADDCQFELSIKYFKEQLFP
ncbi:MAG: hypothetical protein K0U66_08885, partial [Gammaproteobacteria bacterium]|nr:hypothetical protein [Gammaproteobacteria bacterium]